MEAIYVRDMDVDDETKTKTECSRGAKTHLVVEGLHVISCGHGVDASGKVRRAVLDVRHLVARVVVLLRVRVLSTTTAISSASVPGVFCRV